MPSARAPVRRLLLRPLGTEVRDCAPRRCQLVCPCRLTFLEREMRRRPAKLVVKEKPIFEVGGW